MILPPIWTIWKRSRRRSWPARRQTRPAKKPVGLRLRTDYSEATKEIGERMGIPYRTLIQMWLVEKLRQEARDLLPKRG